MALPYYFTLDVQNSLRSTYEKKALKQEEMIYHLFTLIPNGTMGEIIDIFKELKIKISDSSIGRALSNLVDRKKIYQTDEQRDGNWGVGNTVYALVTKETEDEALAKWEARKIGVKFSKDEFLILEMVLTEFNKTNKEYEPIVYKTVTRIISLLNKR